MMWQAIRASEPVLKTIVIAHGRGEAVEASSVLCKVSSQQEGQIDISTRMTPILGTEAKFQISRE